MDERLKVVIVAANASSAFGGESFLPLKYFELLSARGHDVRLVTHARNRPNLETELPHLAGKIEFVENSQTHQRIWRACSVLPNRLRDIAAGFMLTLLTERALARLVQSHVRQGLVDVIHQPIPVSPRHPSSIHGFGLPVVIGPMNGNMTYPRGYEDHESELARRFITIGRMVAVALNWVIPGKRQAAALIVANARTRAALPVAHPRIIELVENAVDLRTWSAPAPRADRDRTAPFRLAFVGRLVNVKCLDITFQAVAMARAAGVEVCVDVLGNGLEEAALRAQAAALGLDVRFHGFQPQAYCATVLAEADALVLNSVRECGGAVVLEAMALGLPVIASDWGGPADYLDASCGILVHPEPRESFAERTAAAILKLANDPDLCRKLGSEGMAKVRREFTWEKRIDQIEDIYRTSISANRRA